MADNSNIPEAEDTKTRVTAKITPGTPGKSAPQIDLETRNAAPADASSTMTRRTLKLQGLAGLAAAPKPAASPQPAAAPASSGEDDTRTRRTVKLASLASGPAAVKPLSPVKPAAPAPAPAPAAAPADASSTMTRRTQKLTALDTKEVAAMTAADLAKPAAKLGAAAAQPAPAAATPRQTVKVDGIAPAHTPVIDLDAKVGDTNTRKTVKIEVPAATAPEIDLNATSPDDTRTKKATKIAPEQFKNNNVDDTVKLQRPAPKPAMPGSVAPAAQPGGIKLNKPAAPAPKMAIPKPEPAPAPAPAAPVAPAAEEKPAEPTGNLGKDQTPPKEKKGLKVNTDALKDLGSAPMVQGDAPASVVGGAPVRSTRTELTGVNISFAIFGVLAALFMIFIALVAVTDYFNIWHPSESGRIDLPIISDHVYSNISIKK